MTHTVSLTPRVITSGPLDAVAGIHLGVWANHGYQTSPLSDHSSPLIGIRRLHPGPGLPGHPPHLVALVAAASVLFAAATLGAVILSVNVGLVGFTGSTTAPLFNQAIAVEAAAIVAGALLAPSSRHQPTIQEVVP
jgi:hypothetical protein